MPMTTALTREQIEGLRKLAEAATPGPWCRNGPYVYRSTSPHDANGFRVGSALDAQDASDADFIIAARSALPALCTMALLGIELERDLIGAYQQLEYLWQFNHSCPCGARPGSLNTHSHDTDCPTAKAVELLAAKEKQA